MQKNRSLILVVFLIMVGVQIYVPASMVIGKENIVKKGTEIRLEVAPIDPNDPFRGKYVDLNFRNEWVSLDGSVTFDYGEPAYLVLAKDSSGFWIPDDLQKSKPEGKDYIKIKVEGSSLDHASFYYPFDRFYMDENKALAAENLYFESLADSTKRTYAVVYIKDGEAVLQDVQIDGTSIVDLVGEAYP